MAIGRNIAGELPEIPMRLRQKLDGAFAQVTKGLHIFVQTVRPLQALAQRG